MPGRVLLIISFVLFFILAGKAQIVVPYVIGNFSFSDSSIGQNNYGFLDSGKCLISSGGVATYLALQNTSKTFFPVCPEDSIGQNICPIIGYPNPTRGYVTIKSGLCYNQYYFLKGVLIVSDAFGIPLIKKDIMLYDIRNGYKVDLTPYAQGIYFFRIYFLNSTVVIKILKNTSAGGN